MNGENSRRRGSKQSPHHSHPVDVNGLRSIPTPVDVNGLPIIPTPWM